MFRIMKINEFNDAIFYKASCWCTDDSDNMVLELEMDKELNCINLNIYQKLTYASYWYIKSNRFIWFIDKWRRIKGAIKLLLTGEIKVEGNFTFEGGKHIEDFLDCLNKGMIELKEKNKGNDVICI